MSHPLTGIDHVFVLVEDLATSAERYARLGFTLSPRALHSAAKGSANHTLVFENDYLELLGLVAATAENAPRRDALARDGEGLGAIACRTEDAEGAVEALTARGIRTGAISRFERPVPLPGGGSERAAFTTLAIAPEETPAGHAFLCQHHTPAAVYRPELMAHPNGARALGAILVTSAAPRRTADRYARLFGTGERVVADEGGFAVPTAPAGESHAASARIVVLAPDRLAGRYPGLELDGSPAERLAGVEIVVDDPHATRRTLARGGVDALAAGDGVAVAPRFCSGALVAFVTR